MKSINSLALTILFTIKNIVSYSKVGYNKGDVAIVLGTAVNGDKPSIDFRRRINHAIRLYKTSRIKKIIFTGGCVYGRKYSESEIAKNYALEKNIPEEDIIIEKKSTNTYQNIVEAKKIVDKLSVDNVLIISDPYHMKRAMKLANSIGLDALPSPAYRSAYNNKIRRARFLLRESISYLFTNPKNRSD